MIGQVRDWLPDGFVNHEVVRETIDQAVAQWGERWFVGAYASVTGMKTTSGDPRNESDDAGWRVYRQAVGIRGERSGFSRMVDKALDINTEMSNLTETDHDLLRAMMRKILEDLAEVLEQAFGVPGDLKPSPQRLSDPLAGGGGLVMALTDPSGRNILTLAIPNDVILARVKAHLGLPSPSSETLQPLAAALGGVTVAIEAVVGTVELSLTELNDLAIGDVLVLDRAVDQPVDIAGVVSHHVFAKAMLTDGEDGLALVFNS